MKLSEYVSRAIEAATNEGVTGITFDLFIDTEMNAEEFDPENPLHFPARIQFTVREA